MLLIGGEYTLLSNNPLTFSFTNQMAIYDPKADTWTMVAPPFNPAVGFHRRLAVGAPSQWAFVARVEVYEGYGRARSEDPEMDQCLQLRQG